MAILVVTQVERDNAAGVIAHERRYVRAAMISVSRVQNKRDEGWIGHRVEISKKVNPGDSMLRRACSGDANCPQQARFYAFRAILATYI
jgi:hypothetical protein